MVERRLVAIRGTVQGVGFRPFVQGLATTFELRGLVRNDTAGVVVDVEGPSESLDRFLTELRVSPPPLAVIESVFVESAPPVDYAGFAVAVSDSTGSPTALISPDAATCEACLAELFDTANRRYRHPFITCTHCGPRFTIVRGVPYDRSRTTMAGFPMCAACEREYRDPADRRFHAQPISCHDCGPKLGFRRAGAPATEADGEHAMRQAVETLRRGGIVAIKGLGGYHLCCNAHDEAAVSRLRARKHREAKPFAVMVRDQEAARTVALVNAAEAKLLAASARPIVLLEARTGHSLARSIAPGVPTLGVMLPYTPVHHLLLADFAGPVVMTSGNRSDEPIAFHDAMAFEQLHDVADGFLTHDREIATRCDDSVMRVVAGYATFMRRSRGYAPRPLRLAIPFAAPVLALGGHLKNTFCLGRGHQAFLSHHVGDLEHPAALVALREGIAHATRLHGVQPRIVAHDMHDHYLSSQLAASIDLPAFAVQHHHAHVAACMAEHGISEPVLGVAFDGAGAGTDGAIWGGEFLLVDGASSQRLGHLGYVPQPGGEAAVREPWRMAAAHLSSAYGSDLDDLALPLLEERPREWATLRQMMVRGFRAPPTSSVGRLFDAVAALVTGRSVVAYEAEAAIALEALADRSTSRSYAPALHEAGDLLIAAPEPIVRGVVDDLARSRPSAEIAGAFHNALRDMIVAVIARLVRRTGVHRVALTGGVFQNTLLLERTAEALAATGCEVLVHQMVPCNDGGLSLGQAVVASALFTSMGA